MVPRYSIAGRNAQSSFASALRLDQREKNQLDNILKSKFVNAISKRLNPKPVKNFSFFILSDSCAVLAPLLALCYNIIDLI